MKNWIIVFLTFLSIVGKAQTMREIKDIKYKNIADILIKAQMDSTFIDNIVHSRTSETFFNRCQNVDEIDFKSKPTKYVSVYYNFVDSCGQPFGYRIKGFQTSSFEFTFTLEYDLICEPNYSLLNEISKAHYDCYISYGEAQRIAIENTNSKSRKTWTNVLINDLVTNQIYWLIKRETGFRKGFIETLKIDAKNGKVLEKKEEEFYPRSFFKALYK